jgi:hypothetical protein
LNRWLVLPVIDDKRLDAVSQLNMVANIEKYWFVNNLVLVYSHNKEKYMSQNESQQSDQGMPDLTNEVWAEVGVMPLTGDISEIAAAVKTDLEKMALIEQGAYVSPEENPEEFMGDDAKQMKVWLNNIRRFEAEAEAEVASKTAEGLAKAAAEAEAARIKKISDNKALGESVALYILMRTDLASLNPGKAVAQGTHATNLFVNQVEELRKGWPDAPNVEAYTAWASDRGFGTAITLGVNGIELRMLIEDAIAMGCISGICTDPTYPLRDGDVTHLLNLDTCGYIFGNREYLASILGHLDLMR